MSAAPVLSSINHQSPVIARRLATNVDVLLLAVLQQGADVCSLAASLDGQPSVKEGCPSVLDEILGKADADRVRAIANVTAVLAAVATGKEILDEPFEVAWPGDALRHVFGFPEAHHEARASGAEFVLVAPPIVPPNPTQTPPAPVVAAPGNEAPSDAAASGSDAPVVAPAGAAAGGSESPSDGGGQTSSTTTPHTPSTPGTTNPVGANAAPTGKGAKDKGHKSGK